jgi:hypothetical protein
MHTEFWLGNLGERPYASRRLELEDNIKVNGIETGRKGLDYINFAVDRLQERAFVNMVTNLWVI